MDLFAHYKKLLQPAANVAGKALSGAGNVLLSAIPGAQALKQVAPTVANTKFLPGQTQTLAQSYKQVMADPNQSNVYHALASGNLRTGTPVIDLPVQLAGQYVQGQFTKPIQAGLQNLQKPGLANKALGGVNLLQGGFNATPAGVGTNLLVGLGASALERGRTGKTDLLKNLTNPSDIAGTGLGVTNPLGALAIDTLVTRSPKKILEDPLLIKGGLKALKSAFVKDAYQQVDKNGPEMLDALKRYTYHYEDNLPASFDDATKIRADLETAYKQLYGAREKLPQNIYDLASKVKAGYREFYQRPIPPPKAPGTPSNALGITGAAPTEKYAANINLDRLTIPPAAKRVLTNQIAAIRPELEQVKGKVLTNAEVKDAAAQSAILQQITSREQTAAFTASLTRLRQAVAAGAEGKGLTPDFVENLKVLSSQAADTGRRLQSFAIDANSAEYGVKERIIRQLTKLGFTTDELVKAGENIDWNDANQVTNYYRTFVKPTAGELANEFRYMNLLSSPRTHIVNAFSNALQAGITAPVTKLVSGAIDPIASALTGTKRQAYVSEVPAYYRGMFASIPDAIGKVQGVFSGKQAITNLDLDRIPSGTALSKGNVVSKALEASDQFFRTLIAGGEREALGNRFRKTGDALGEAKLGRMAEDTASYYTFRQGLDSHNATGQGHLLSWLDHGTEAILTLRRVPGISWFIPFVQTPMNILKQGVEYSPVGLATLPGASNQREQFAKALVGSSVFMGAGYLAMQDRLTWGAPKDPEQKQAFYAAGMQPYAVKVGEKWVSFSKIGPLAYPLALAASLKYAYQDNPNAVTQGNLEKIGDGLAGYMGFFADQSYLQGIGDLVKAVQGQQGYSSPFATAAGNVVNQYVPLSSLLRWTTQIIDPYYRKGDTLAQNVEKNIPFLSGNAGTYADPLGQPSQRQMPLLNAVSPLPVTNERPMFKELYDLRQGKLEGNAILRAQKQALQNGQEPPGFSQASAAGGPTTSDLVAKQKADMAEQLARQKIAIKGGADEVNGKILYKDNKGKVQSLDLAPLEQQATGIDAIVQRKDQVAMARKLYSVKGLTIEKKQALYTKLGVKPEEAQYDYLSHQDADVKAKFLASKLDGLAHDQVLSTLRATRTESISGARYATDSVLTMLSEGGIISPAELQQLKKVQPGKAGAAIKAKTAKVRAVRLPKFTVRSSGQGLGKVKAHIIKVKPRKLTVKKLATKKKILTRTP